MRKVSMNERQFERFITENAIRVAHRYLMETSDMGADSDVYDDYDEDYDNGYPYEDEGEDYQTPRF